MPASLTWCPLPSMCRSHRHLFVAQQHQSPSDGSGSQINPDLRKITRKPPSDIRNLRRHRTRRTRTPASPCYRSPAQSARHRRHPGGAEPPEERPVAQVQRQKPADGHRTVMPQDLWYKTRHFFLPLSRSAEACVRGLVVARLRRIDLNGSGGRCSGHLYVSAPCGWMARRAVAVPCQAFVPGGRAPTGSGILVANCCPARSWYWPDCQVGSLVNLAQSGCGPGELGAVHGAPGHYRADRERCRATSRRR